VKNKWQESRKIIKSETARRRNQRRGSKGCFSIARLWEDSKKRVTAKETELKHPNLERNIKTEPWESDGSREIGSRTNIAGNCYFRHPTEPSIKGKWKSSWSVSGLTFGEITVQGGAIGRDVIMKHKGER